MQKENCSNRCFSNWGTENQPDFAYNNGNGDNIGKGFGHTSVLVDDLKEACKRLESLGVKFHKKLTEGGVHTIAFIADPDDYWIEVSDVRIGSSNVCIF